MKKTIPLLALLALVVLLPAARGQSPPRVNPNPSIPLRTRPASAAPQGMVRVNLIEDGGFESCGNGECPWSLYGSTPEQVVTVRPYLGDYHIEQGVPGGLDFAEQAFVNPVDWFMVEVCWNIATEEPEPADNDVMEIFFIEAATGLTTDSLFVVYDGDETGGSYHCERVEFGLWPGEWRFVIGSLNNNTHPTRFLVDEAWLWYPEEAPVVYSLYLPAVSR